jgi:chorismate mutase/prephenate dehydrogenase
MLMEKPIDRDLERVRERMRALDRELVALAAERVRLARQVGEVKRRYGLAVVDYAQERQVLDRAAATAAAEGLDPQVAGDLLARLIRAAVTVQEEENLRHAATGEGKTAVVVGGAGRMGRWMGRFLAAQGWEAVALDPAAPADEDARGRALLASAELVVCATPPRQTARRYREWRDRPPAGVVVDIASIKTPLLEPIAELAAAGARVASIHPMFGPATVVLRDADVVVCDTGDEAATAEVESLFAATTARLVRLPLAEHDRIMADLLSLAHATAIAFALALPPTDHPVRSTTFQALAGLAATAVRESPEVYYEIQAENPESVAAVEKLAAAVERLLATVRDRRPEEFAGLMDEGRQRTRPERPG